MTKMADRLWAKMLKAAAEEYGDAVTPSQFLGSTEFPHEALGVLFQLWPRLRWEAGLEARPPRRRRPKFTNDDLLAEYDRVAGQLGRSPTWMELNRDAAMNYQTFRERFGKMADLKRAHRNWMRLNRRAAAGDEAARAELIKNAIANRTLAAPAETEVPARPAYGRVD